MDFRLFRVQPVAPTNDALVDHLVHSGSITSDKIEAAFRAVDRAKFIPGIGEDAYDDAPIRDGNFHMSQPSLYASALEALDLQSGISFLNVGCGTGYLSSIVAEVAGHSVHHGLDIHPDVLNHAAKTLREQGKDFVELFAANVHDVNPSWSPRYDRIYVGACADGSSTKILEMLSVGGILVGPFTSSVGQHFKRVHRKTETLFEVKFLNFVRFVSLQPSSGATASFGLPVPAWTPCTHHLHSKAFRETVMAVLCSTTRTVSPTYILPREILVDHVFGYLHPRWFDEQTSDAITVQDEEDPERMRQGIDALRGRIQLGQLLMQMLARQLRRGGDLPDAQHADEEPAENPAENIARVDSHLAESAAASSSPGAQQVDVELEAAALPDVSAQVQSSPESSHITEQETVLGDAEASFDERKLQLRYFFQESCGSDSNRLSESEFSDSMKLLGSHLTYAELSHLHCQAEKDIDNRVDVDELLDFLLR